MSTCHRCKKKIRFVDGFFSFKGVICPECRETEELKDTLEKLLRIEDPLELSEELKGNPEKTKDAIRLLELDADQYTLIIALTKLKLEGQLESSNPLFDKPEYKEVVLKALYERDPNPGHLQSLIEMGSLPTALRLLSQQELEVSDANLQLLKVIVDAGQSDAALGLALKMRGLRTRSLCDFIVTHHRTGDGEILTEWLTRSSLLNIADLHAFLISLKQRQEQEGLSADEYQRLETAAGSSLSEADRLLFLSLLGDEEKLEVALGDISLLTSDVLSTLEQLAAGPGAPVIFTVLEKQVTNIEGQTDRIADLIATLGRSLNEIDRAVEILMTMELWQKARELLIDVEQLTEEKTSSMRKRCRSFILANEVKAQKRINRAMELALEGDFTKAQSELGTVLRLGKSSAPAAYLNAAALDLLITAVEVETVLSLNELCTRVADERQALELSPLPDSRKIPSSIEHQREELDRKATKFNEIDNNPHPLLRWPDMINEGDFQNSIDEDNRREEHFAQAAKEKNITTLTEQRLVTPTRIRLLCTWLREASGINAKSANGWRPFERALFYGLIAHRLFSPVNEKSKKLEITGDRDLAVDCALRGLAFMPDVPTTMGTQWGDFFRNISGFLRHLGFQAVGVKKISEYWPSWLAADDKPSMEARDLAILDHLPPLDKSTAVNRDSLYQPPNQDLNPAPPPEEKKVWT